MSSPRSSVSWVKPTMSVKTIAPVVAAIPKMTATHSVARPKPTIHANSARTALTRLSSLVQEAGVPPQPELIAETINLLAFIIRTPAGRRVKELVRVEGYSATDGFKLTSPDTQSSEGSGQ